MTGVRKLTQGERVLASSIFGSAIDLDLVELRHRKWSPFQPRDVVMAPCGHIYFHPKGEIWREDFSRERVPMRAMLVHELCHVWQSQSGLFLPLRRLPFARYSYTLRPGRSLRSYGIEQQAEIVANAYLIRKGFRRVTGEEPLQHEQLVAQIS